MTQWKAEPVPPRRIEGAQETGKAAQKEMKEERAEHHFKVTGLKHISPTCP